MTPNKSLSPETQQRFLRYRWVVYGAPVTCLVLVFFVWVIPATIGEQLSREWNLNATSLGLLGSFLFYPYALMQVPAGYLADTWGPRRTVTVAMLVMALGQFLFAQATGLPMALLGRAIAGLGAAVVLIALMKILVNWFRVREFATLVGVANLFGFGGSILGTTPLALAVIQWGWRLPLLWVGGLTLALAVLTWLLVRDTPQEMGLPAIAQLDPDSKAAVDDNPGKLERRPLITEAILTWLRTPTVWIVSILIFVSWGTFQAFQALWAGPYLIHVHHKSTVESSFSLVLLSLGGGLGTTVAGYLSDKVFQARQPFLLVGTLTLSLAWAGLVATTGGASDLVINLTFLLLSVSIGFVLIGQAMVKEVVRPAIFGTVFGMVNMFPFIGNALFQLLMGALLNRSGAILSNGSRVYSSEGYWLAFMPALIASVLCLVLSLFVPETLKQK